MPSIYVDYVKCLYNIEDLLNQDKFSFIKYSFVFGSLSRKLIHEDSDIDLLLIGTEKKTIDLMTLLSKSIDECLDVYKDVDIKYYEINEFRKLRDSNLFLRTIEEDCKELRNLSNELLRFCN